MREEKRAQVLVPPWNLVYLNTSNNSRQGRPTAAARTENESELRRLEKQQLSSKSRKNLPRHSNSRVDKTARNEETLDEFKELNYALMRENVEKMKRIRILKQAKCLFNQMFARVQTITDGLKIQLDEAMKEHRKANKMFNKLHSHIIDVHNRLQSEYDDTIIAFETNDIELESTRDRLSPRRLLLPKIESASSSRPCSLPEVFKIESSTQSPCGECFSTSKTNNIRKIAVKKSQEKSSLIETRDRRRKTDIIEVGDETCRPRNSSLKTNSASLKSSEELIEEKPRVDHKGLGNTESILLPSDSELKKCDAEHQTNIGDKSTSMSSAESAPDKLVGSVNSADTTTQKESVLQRSVMYSQTSSSILRNKNNSTIIRQKGYGPASQCVVNCLEGKGQERKRVKCTDAKNKSFSKLKRKQIAEEIKSIEDCIIQPNQLRKAGVNSSFEKDLKPKQESSKNTNNTRKK